MEKLRRMGRWFSLLEGDGGTVWAMVSHARRGPQAARTHMGYVSHLYWLKHSRRRAPVSFHFATAVAVSIDDVEALFCQGGSW
jgi:hypothetical protein